MCEEGAADRELIAIVVHLRDPLRFNEEDKEARWLRSILRRVSWRADWFEAAILRCRTFCPALWRHDREELRISAARWSGDRALMIVSAD